MELQPLLQHGASLAASYGFKSLKRSLDWHYVGGRGRVLHLGDSQSLERVIKAIEMFPFEWSV